MIHIDQNLYVTFEESVSGKIKSRVLRLLQKDIHPEEALRHRFDMDFSITCYKMRDKFSDEIGRYLPTVINLVVIGQI